MKLVVWIPTLYPLWFVAQSILWPFLLGRSRLSITAEYLSWKYKDNLPSFLHAGWFTPSSLQNLYLYRLLLGEPPFIIKFTRNLFLFTAHTHTKEDADRLWEIHIAGDNHYLNVQFRAYRSRRTHTLQGQGTSQKQSIAAWRNAKLIMMSSICDVHAGYSPPHVYPSALNLAICWCWRRWCGKHAILGTEMTSERVWIGFCECWSDNFDSPISHSGSYTSSFVSIWADLFCVWERPKYRV